MVDEQWLLATLRTAVTSGYPVALIHGWRVRIYSYDGYTKFTFDLEGFTEKIQEDAVDLIFPFIQ